MVTRQAPGVHHPGPRRPAAAHITSPRRRARARVAPAPARSSRAPRTSASFELRPRRGSRRAGRRRRGSRSGGARSSGRRGAGRRPSGSTSDRSASRSLTPVRSRPVRSWPRSRTYDQSPPSIVRPVSVDPAKVAPTSLHSAKRAPNMFALSKSKLAKSEPLVLDPFSCARVKSQAAERAPAGAEAVRDPGRGSSRSP